jgi:hypothetical protein
MDYLMGHATQRWITSTEKMDYIDRKDGLHRPQRWITSTEKMDYIDRKNKTVKKVFQ